MTRSRKKMKTGQNVSVEPTLASRLSSIVIFLAILCCLVPGEIENLVIPYLTVLAIVTLLISVMGRKNRAPSIGKNSTKMAQQWFLGFAIFALGYTLSLICGVYGSRHGFDLNAREVAFYCRLLLVPILSFLWLQFQFAWSRQIFFGLTLAFCTFGLWGLAQFLNASFHWELTLFSFSGPLDSGAARLYHHRPIAFAWQLSLWLIPGFFLLKLNREFISRSVPVWLFKFSLLTTFLAGLATGNRSFVVLSFVALVTEGYLSIGSSLKKKPVKSSLVIAATLLALMIFSPGMSRLKNFEQGSAGGYED